MADRQDINDNNGYIPVKGGYPYVVDEKGSLGLLALGYRGLIAWRNIRQNKIQVPEGDDDSKDGE